MTDQSKYRDMVDSGAGAGEVYLAAKADGLGWIGSIRLIRELFGLSLVDAKEVSVVADGLGSSLSEYQESFIPILEALMKEEQKGS